MRHLMRAVLVVLLSAGLASAAAIGINGQQQGQFDGSAAGSIPGIGAGFIGGGAQAQIGGGFSASNQAGDEGAENQAQTQTTTEFNSVGGPGQGAFFQSVSTQNQVSASQAGEDGVDAQGNPVPVGGPGAAGNAQAQANIGGAAGASTGNAGIAGSAQAAGAIGGSFAVGDAFAVQVQNQNAGLAYQVDATSASGRAVTSQSGESAVATQQFSVAADGGAAFGASGVLQAGGSAVANDDNAGFMQGSAAAAGDAGAVSGNVGNAAGGAAAQGTQTHRYSQASISADGSNTQAQAGQASTSVQATSTSP